MDERQLQQLVINISALHQELQKQSAEALSLQAQGVRRLEEGLSEVNRLVADEVSNQMAACQVTYGAISRKAVRKDWMI